MTEDIQISSQPWLISLKHILPKHVGYVEHLQITDTIPAIDKRLTPTQRVTVNMTLTTIPDGIKLHATTNCTYTYQCDLCLDPGEIKIAIKLNITATQQIGEQQEQEEFHQISAARTIDLLPLLQEEIALQTPMNLWCKPDCQGVCLVCGINKNHETCPH